MSLNIVSLGVGLLDTCCYIVYKDGERECTVIDPGGSYNDIFAKLSELNLSVGKILLTHGHFDHILALPSLKEKTGAPVLIGRGDAELLTDSELNLFARFFPKKSNNVKADILLSDGDSFNVGGVSYTVFETPGHTKGSVCFLADEGVLFSGDTLFRFSVGRTDFPTSSSEDMACSLARLSRLPGTTEVYPGHGASTTIQDEITHNPYMSSL